MEISNAIWLIYLLEFVLTLIGTSIKTFPAINNTILLICLSTLGFPFLIFLYLSLLSFLLSNS